MTDWLGNMLATTPALRQMRIAPEDMERTLWMPPQASSVAPVVDHIFYFILGVSIFFFVLIVAAMVYFIWRYRMRSPGAPATGRATHNTALELTWSIIPLILVVIMFYAGFKGFVSMMTPAADGMDIRVRAYKWGWEFNYPGGHSDSDLHIPKGQPIRLTLESADVIHSFWVPAFRIKRDAVPGRYNRIHFEATEPGDYLALCAEYCGTSHSTMLAMVRVYDSHDAWLAWLTRAADPFGDQRYQTYADIGRVLYTRRCATCHSVDGSGGTGPTFKGLYESQRQFTDGTTAIADDNYIRESILYPQRKIVQGYAGVMSAFPTLSDRDITALIEFIKEVSGRTALPLPGRDGASEEAPPTESEEAPAEAGPDTAAAYPASPADGVATQTYNRQVLP